MADQSDPERLHGAEQLARELDRRDRQTFERAMGRSGRTENPRDEWLRDAYAARSHEDRPVRQVTKADHALPSHARKILSVELLEELVRILDEIRVVNDGLVGLPTRVAQALLSDDELVLEVRLALRRWAVAYVEARLQKPSTHAGDPAERFRRLLRELLPWLDTLAFGQDTVHYAFLAEVLDYVPWLAALKTIMPWYDEDPLSDPFAPRWRFRAPNEVDRQYCQEIAQLYGWPGASDVDRVVEAIVARGAARPVPSVDDAREKLATLAAEIREVRPFVLASFNPEKCAAEVAPGLTASWHWGGPLQLGMVPVHQDERRRVREFQSLTFAVAVRVGHDGRIASELAPWVDVDTVDLEPSLALGANLAFLEPLHARLLDVFARIDLAAIHDRVRRDAKGDAGTHPPSQEAVAASLEVPTTSPQIEATETPAPYAPTRPRVPTLRMERFLAILERLGCEVRQGKGSEVVAYRAGGKIAVIGRHTRNRQISSALAQRVLHQVGVTLAEWLRAVDR